MIDTPHDYSNPPTCRWERINEITCKLGIHTSCCRLDTQHEYSNPVLQLQCMRVIANEVTFKFET